MTNSVVKKQKLLLTIDTFNDRQTGQEKKKRRQVGEIIHWSDGGISVDTWGPSGVQRLQAFDYQDDNQSQSQGQQGTQFQPQQQQQQQPQQQQQQGFYQPPQGGYQSPQGGGSNA